MATNMARGVQLQVHAAVLPPTANATTQVQRLRRRSRLPASSLASSLSSAAPPVVWLPSSARRCFSSSSRRQRHAGGRRVVRVAAASQSRTEKPSVQRAERGMLEVLVDKRPPVDVPISYSRMLEFLAAKQVSRLDLYDDGKLAILQIPLGDYTEDTPHEKREYQNLSVDLPADCVDLMVNVRASGCKVLVHSGGLIPPMVLNFAGLFLPVIGFSIFHTANLPSMPLVLSLPPLIFLTHVMQTWCVVFDSCFLALAS